jgi:hypothetical protein
VAAVAAAQALMALMLILQTLVTEALEQALTQHGQVLQELVQETFMLVEVVVEETEH